LASDKWTQTTYPCLFRGVCSRIIVLQTHHSMGAFKYNCDSMEP